MSFLKKIHTMLITAIIFDKVKTKLAQQQKDQEELPKTIAK
jgi:hypothetical protein